MNNDRGSASIWVLACGLVVVAFGYAVTLLGGAVLARHRAADAADLAALAAAGRIGVGGEPCAEAQAIASANHAVLVRCATQLDTPPRSGSVTVTVEVHADFPIVGAVTATGSSRAGRLPANDPPTPPVRGPPPP